MRKIYEAAVILIGTMGWWGFVYPDMCLTEDTYEQACEEEQVQTLQAELKQSKTGSCYDKESANRHFAREGWQVGDICIKSRIMEYIYQER